MNRIEPRNAKISYYTRFSKFLQGSSSVPLFFGGFLRSSIHYSLIYIIYPKTPLACDESTNCFRGKQLVCIQGEYVPLLTISFAGISLKTYMPCWAVAQVMASNLNPNKKWKSCVWLERNKTVKCLFTNEMMIILMNRHLLENMLEVHLAHISPLHCHSADDRNIKTKRSEDCK